MDFEDVIGKWARARNRLCLLLSAGNLLMTVLHGLMATLILFLLGWYFVWQPTMEFGVLWDWALKGAAVMLVLSTLLCLTTKHRPSFSLMGIANSHDSDHWADGLSGPAADASAIIPSRYGIVFFYLFFVLSGCFYGSGRRLLRAFGIFRNWIRFSPEESLALGELLASLRRREENRPWFPVGEYREALPFLEEFLRRDIVRSAADEEGNLRLRLDRELWCAAGLPEPVAQPRARFAQ